jgi:hypothetical protein
MKGLEIDGRKENYVYWKLDGVPGRSRMSNNRAMSAEAICEHYTLARDSSLVVMNAVDRWVKEVHPIRIAKARQLLIIDGLDRLVEVPEDAASYVDEGGCVWVQCWYSIGDDVC